MFQCSYLYIPNLPNLPNLLSKYFVSSLTDFPQVVFICAHRLGGLGIPLIRLEKNRKQVGKTGWDRLGRLGNSFLFRDIDPP